MRNKFPGKCYQCGEWVKKGEGHFQRHQGSWIVHHATCAIQNRESRKQKSLEVLSLGEFMKKDFSK